MAVYEALYKGPQPKTMTRDPKTGYLTMGDLAQRYRQQNAMAADNAQIAQDQGSANVDATMRNTANNSPTVQSDFNFGAGAGNQAMGQNKVRQSAYEAQALEALRQHGTAGQQASQQQGAKDLQQGQFGQEASMFDKRVAANNARMQQLTAQFQSSSGGGGSQGGVAPVEYDTPGLEAANAASFAREKDKIGQMGRGAVNSLTNLMSSSGLSGGGYEQKGLADIVGGTQGQLGDVTREQTIQDLATNRNTANMNYQGGIQQRGQTLQDQQARAQMQKQALMQLFSMGGIY